MTTWAAEFVIVNGQWIAGAMPLAAIPITRTRAWLRRRADLYDAIAEHQAVETWADEHPGEGLGYWSVRERIENEARWAAAEAQRMATHTLPSTTPDPSPLDAVAAEAGVPREVVKSAVEYAVASYLGESPY